MPAKNGPGIERRRFPRRKINLEIRIKSKNDDLFDLAVIRDISEGGAFIEIERRLTLGEKIHVAIYLEGGVELLSCRARVVREERGSRSGIGVEFINLKNEDKKKVRDLVLSMAIGE